MEEGQEFQERVQPLWRPLYAFARRLVDRDENAVDVLQNALAAAFRARRAYDGERPFRAWLAGFVVRCASSQNRRRCRVLRPAEEIGQQLAAEWDYERILARPEEALDWIPDALAAAVRALPPGEREVLLLRALLSRGATWAASRGISNGASTSPRRRERSATPTRSRGYRIAVRGEYQSMRESFAHFAKGFGIAAVLVYLVMVAQFRSFLDPFVVLLAVPLALVGVVLALLAAVLAQKRAERRLHFTLGRR